MRYSRKINFQYKSFLMYIKSIVVRNIRLLILLSIHLILLSSSSLYSQSLKKTFKFIENNEIEKAELELSQFTDEVKSSQEEIMLYSLANCLLLCDEKIQTYEPYKALEIYETASNLEVDKSEVDKFLSKYSQSIVKINETVCSSILYQAKQINTEASYKKALMVGYKCGFKSEVDTLWTNAAYNEAKSANTYEAYVKFYTYHGNSRYKQEVFKKFNEFEFQRAKRNLSLESLNLYINGHSDKGNPYLQEAIHLRDSIAFSTVNKIYADYQEFLDKYPNSEYTEEIKHVLPDLLYEEADSNSSIILFEKFLSDFPNDSRKSFVKAELEKLEFEDVIHNMTHENIAEFRKQYPESNFNDSITLIVNSLQLKNDLSETNLIGKVKSVQESSVLHENTFYPPTVYDEFGRIVSKLGDNANIFNIFYGHHGLRERLLHVDDDDNYRITSVTYYFYDNNDRLIADYRDDINIPYNEYRQLIENNKFNWNKKEFNPSIEEYKYNSNGHLIQKRSVSVPRDHRGNYYNDEYRVYNEVRYKYNSSGKLIEVIGEGLQDSVVFKYNNQGQLIEKHSFPKSIGMGYIEKYNSKGQVFEKQTYHNSKYEFKTLFKYNEKGLLIEDVVHTQNGVHSPDITEYTYDRYGNWVSKRIIMSGYTHEALRKIEYYEGD